MRAGLQRVEKRGAGGGEIESPDAASAEFVLHETGGRGKKHVGRNGRDQDGFEVGRRNAALDKGFPCSLDSEVAGGNALVGEMAFPNAGALEDPVIRGLNHFFQVSIAQNTWRNVGSEGADLGAHKLAHSCVSIT